MAKTSKGSVKTELKTSRPSCLLTADLYDNKTKLNKWSLGKWKGNYFECLEFSFHDSSYYTAFSLSPHSSGLCCKQRRKNYKLQKLHYPLEQDYGLKRISYFQKINVQVCLFWQGTHLAKYASKGIYVIRKMVTFLFLPFLWPLWSVFDIQLHVIFYTFGYQHARLVCVCIKM